MPPLPSLTTAAVAALLLYTAVASPCSPEYSTPSVRLPRGEPYMPANLIRFRVLDMAHAHKLSISTAQGKRVPTHIEGDVLVTKTPPAPGQLVLTYPSKLRNGDIKTATYAFQVTEPTPLELRKPSLWRFEQGVRYPDDERNRTAFVQLRYGTPSANGAGEHLFEHTVTVDGRPFRFDFGATEAAGVPIIEVRSRCVPFEDEPLDWAHDSCRNINSVPPGDHTVTVRTTIIGETTQPAPVSHHIHLSCRRTTQ